MSGIKRVLIAGATGNIGQHLCKALSAKGYDVNIVTRKPAEGKQDFPKLSWESIENEGLPAETDAVINLCGHPIGMPGRFTEELKKTIRDSRILTNEKLGSAIERDESPPSVFLAASAVGIYDVSTDIEYTEDTKPCEQQTFLTKLCQEWEQSSVLPDSVNTRVVNLRFGVNISHDTYPMDSLLLPTFYMGLGGRVGSGTQPFPWVHVQDSVGITMLALESEEVKGAVNVVAPALDTNQDFTDKMGLAFNTYTLCTILEFQAKLMYGAERAPLVLEGQKVLPQKALDAGYEFQYPTLDVALDDIILLWPGGVSGVIGAVQKLFQKAFK